MKNKYPTYIILDIPEPTATLIKNIRSKYHEMRSRLPVEITVFGSTGSRNIIENQNLDFLISEIDKITPQINKFQFSFIGLKPFPKYPGSYLLDPSNKDNFFKIHNLIKNNVNFKYEKDNSDYMPHCTISTCTLNEFQLNEIKIEKIPKEIIELNKLSMVEFCTNPFEINYLKSWELS